MSVCDQTKIIMVWLVGINFYEKLRFSSSFTCDKHWLKTKNYYTPAGSPAWVWLVQDMAKACMLRNGPWSWDPLSYNTFRYTLFHWDVTETYLLDCTLHYSNQVVLTNASHVYGLKQEHGMLLQWLYMYMVHSKYPVTVSKFSCFHCQLTLK